MKHEDYTVAWICALPKERAATLLDEYHEKLPVRQHDTTYVLGRIDVHNVVIACLPTMGTNAAARCATRLQSGFISLRFILMVGIGGGVPTRRDVRLGDIVVSMPGKQHRGVVRYDFGTKFQGKALEIRDAQLNRPPDLLLTAVGEVSAPREKEQKSLGQRLYDYSELLVEKHPQLSNTRRPKTDNLFVADYQHGDDQLTCEAFRCSAKYLVDRPSRGQDIYPKIHLGLIASGDEVMRDAKERDRLAHELDVLCFEMEAGGLMTELGCLVIRGICDYCDSHKNKDWQAYAAAVAAGYAHELLKVIPGLQNDTKRRKSLDKSGPGEAAINQQNTSGGQSSVMSGVVNTYGGKSSVASNYQSKGDMYF